MSNKSLLFSQIIAEKYFQNIYFLMVYLEKIQQVFFTFSYLPQDIESHVHE